MPGSAALMALADALGVSVGYLVGDGDMVLEGVEFRKKRLVGRREEGRIEGCVLDLLECCLSV